MSEAAHALSIIHIMKHSMNAFHNCHRNFAALAMESSNHLSRDEGKKTLLQSKGTVSERLLASQAER